MFKIIGNTIGFRIVLPAYELEPLNTKVVVAAASGFVKVREVLEGPEISEAIVQVVAPLGLFAINVVLPLSTMGCVVIEMEAPAVTSVAPFSRVIVPPLPKLPSWPANSKNPPLEVKLPKKEEALLPDSEMPPPPVLIRVVVDEPEMVPLKPVRAPEFDVSCRSLPKATGPEKAITGVPEEIVSVAGGDAEEKVRGTEPPLEKV
jgi:hypothetical protein